MKLKLSQPKKLLVVLGSILLCFLVLFIIPVEKYEKIDLQSKIKEDERNFPGRDIFSPTNDPDGSYSGKGASLGNITPQTPGIIRIKFKEPVKINGFSLFFFGNLNSVSSAMAKDFQVTYYDVDGKKIIQKEIFNHSSPVYRFLTNKAFPISSLEILISKAGYVDKLGKGTVWFRDVNFFTRKSVPFAISLLDLVRENNRTLMAFWAYYLIFFFFLFIPGFVCHHLFQGNKKFDLSSEEKLISSPLLALVTIPISVTLYLLTGLEILLYTYSIMFIVSLAIFVRAKLYHHFFADKTLLFVMAVSLFVVSLTIAQREYLFNLPFTQTVLDKITPPSLLGYSGYHADSMLPWKIGQIFLHRLDLNGLRAKALLQGTIFDRTPVLPMLTSVIMKYFSESHFVYQRFLETLTVLYYGTFFVLTKKYFSRKIAVITLLLMLINVQLSLMSFNVELYYKYFAIYPILLAIILIIKSKTNQSLAIGLLAGLAFLIHPFTLIPSAAIIVFYLAKYHFQPEFIRHAGATISILLLLFAGWFLTPKIIGLNKNTVRDKSFYFLRATKFEGNMFMNKAVNLVNLIIPNSPLKKVGSQERLSITATEYKQEFFRFSFISNLTPIFFVLLIYYLFKNKTKNYSVVFFGLFPLLFFWLLYLQEFNQSFNYGGSYFLLYPFTLPFLFSYLVSNILKERKIFRLFIFISYPLYMFFILYYVSWVFNNVASISLMTRTIFWLIITTFSVLSLNLVKLAAGDHD